MSAIFSRSCEYAIQAVIYLAKRSSEGKPIHLRTISNELGIPFHFLSKVLQTLSRDEIVLSHKGLRGGFELGRHPSQITLMDIVEAIDGKAFLDRCVLGFSKCNEEIPCPAHHDWKKAIDYIRDVVQRKTIDEFSEKLDGKLLVPHSSAKSIHTGAAPP